MKKLYLPCLILLSLVGSSLQAKITDNCCLVDCIPKNSCDCEITSRSYFSVRPQFQSASPEMVSAFRAERTRAREDGFGGAAQIALFGGKSTNPEDLARYFFFCCKSVLTVDERTVSVIADIFGANDVPPTQPRDLLAQHFNIFTVDGQNENNFNGFRSEIAIEPEQDVVGAGIQYRQSFCQNEDKGRGWFYNFSFPITRVKNKLNFTENVISDGGGPALTVDGTLTDENVVANMTEAFNQTEWRFGKIDTQCCDQSKTGVADIEAKLGYEWLDHEPCHLETYIGIKIPTGNKPTGEYIFEPIVGNGRHWGIMFGNAVGVQIWKDEAKDRSLRVEYNGHTQYLFRNTQCRSVDLKCKPWSRYIELYKDMDQAVTASQFANTNFQANFATPGINILTMPLHVRPGFSHNTNAAAVYASGKLRLEGGYNLYCRQSECIKLPCPWVEGPAIKINTGIGQTLPLREISGDFRIELIPFNLDTDTDAEVAERNAAYLIRLQDYKFNMIKESDLDLVSASSPCIISHTIYGSIGWDFDDKNYPFFVNGGGSYEFSNSNNAVLERWLVWVKGGISF